MDDMGTPGPNHPAHRGLQTPDNVVKLPNMAMRRARIFKNNMLDAVLGPEQVEPDEKMPPEVADRFDDHLNYLMENESHLDNYINSSIENSPQAHELNQMLGRTDNFHDARIISMGKFKEDRDAKRLMGGHDD